MARFLGYNGAVTHTDGWSSGWRETEFTDRITGTAFSDQAGTLYVDQSPDQENVDWTDTVSISASTGAKFSIELVSPYYQVRFVPGSDASTVRIYGRPSSAGSR